MNDPPETAARQGWKRWLADATATRRLGCALAGDLLAAQRDSAPVLLLLRGELGAGKTCLVQGLAEGLGINEPITSPSFALALSLIHISEPTRRACRSRMPSSA